MVRWQSSRRITTSKRRVPSTSFETTRPLESRSQLLGDGLRLQAVERGPRVVDDDLQLRDAHLLFDLQVGEAGDAWPGAPRSASASARSVSRSSPKNLDGDLRPHARQHVIEPVRDRLADIERDRQHGKPRADIGDDRVLAAPASLQVDFDFGGVDAFGMLVELGAAGAPADGFDLGHVRGCSFSAIRPTRFDSASEMPGLNSMLIVKVPSLKGGRNARGSSAAPIAASDHGDRDQRQQQPLPVESALEQRAVGALERAHQPAFALVEPLQARQHVVGHHRRQRDGDHEAGQDRDDVGLAERRKQAPLDAGERKQRHEHQHDDERGVDDARAHLVGGGRPRHRRRSAGCPAARFSRRRRKMFSTSTTASSTSSPMAMARPPSVMVLMDSPIR